MSGSVRVGDRPTCCSDTITMILLMFNGMKNFMNGSCILDAYFSSYGVFHLQISYFFLLYCFYISELIMRHFLFLKTS